MPRTIMDDEFRRWEIYATTGMYGFSDPARVVFHCLSDPGVATRAVTLEGGDKSDAEALVAERGDAELAAMLAEAPEID